MTRALRLPVTTEYFNEIKAGTKPFEYRLDTPYWRRRIVGGAGMRVKP